MKLDKKTIAGLAEHLENAELHARDVTMITGEHPEMDWDDAYAIQDEIRDRFRLPSVPHTLLRAVQAAPKRSLRGFGRTLSSLARLLNDRTGPEISAAG